MERSSDSRRNALEGVSGCPGSLPPRLGPLGARAGEGPGLEAPYSHSRSHVDSAEPPRAALAPGPFQARRLRRFQRLQGDIHAPGPHSAPRNEPPARGSSPSATRPLRAHSGGRRGDSSLASRRCRRAESDARCEGRALDARRIPCGGRAVGRRPGLRTLRTTRVHRSPSPSATPALGRAFAGGPTRRRQRTALAKPRQRRQPPPRGRRA